MLPLTSKEPIRFTPTNYAKDDAKAPVYLLNVPTIAGRADYRRDIIAEGLKYPQDSELHAALKDGIKSIVEESQQQELLDIIDKYNKSDKSARNLQEEMDEIEKTVGGNYSPYRKLLADRGYYVALAPVIAVMRFLKGIENSEINYKSKNNLMDMEVIDLLPEEDVLEVGWKIISLMSMTNEQRKNLH